VLPQERLNAFADVDFDLLTVKVLPLACIVRPDDPTQLKTFLFIFLFLLEGTLKEN